MSARFGESGHRGTTAPTMQTCYLCHNYFRTRLVGGRTRQVEWDSLMTDFMKKGITPPKWMLKSIERSNTDNFVVHDCTQWSK